MDSTGFQAVQGVAESMPSGIIITFGVLFVVGLIGWLLGRALAKPMCVLSGLVLGTVGGITLAEAIGAQEIAVFGLTIGAAIAGALLAAMLFRAWVAVVGAVVLALIVPAGLLVWDGTPNPVAAATRPAETQAEPGASPSPNESPAETPGDDKAAGEAANNATQQLLPTDDGDASDPADPADQADGEGDASAGDVVAATQTRDAAREAIAVLRGLYRQQAEAINQWWGGLEPTTRQRLGYGSAIGAVIGLVLGLFAPLSAAALESALAGAMLMFFTGRAMLGQWFPDQMGWLPQSPRMVIIWLGLITLVGFWFQWIISRRSTDKKD